MIKYIVSLGYSTFEFDDSIEANTFARMAKTSYIKKKYDGSTRDNDIEVTIELVKVDDVVAD